RAPQRIQRKPDGSCSLPADLDHPRTAGPWWGYEQKTFAEAEKRGKLRLVGSRDGRDGSLTIHQDVDLYATALERGERVSLALRAGRGVGPGGRWGAFRQRPAGRRRRRD